jgi:hypothetical protein
MPRRQTSRTASAGVRTCTAATFVTVALLALALVGTASALAGCPRAPKKAPRTTSTRVDLALERGEHDLTFSRVLFRSSKTFQRATVTITNAHDIVFRDCVFEGSAWNNISVNDRSRSVYNVRFVRCYVKASARMGFECTSRGGSVGYTGIRLMGVTFEPQGSEAVSFDGAGSGVLIHNVVIRGAGTNPAFPWGQGFEINGSRNFTVIGLRIYQTRGTAFNLNGPSGSCGWTFRDVRADMSVRYQSVGQTPQSQVLLATGVHGSHWSKTVIRAASPGGGVMYIRDCSGNDFRGIRWLDSRHGFSTGPWQVGSCSGNLF